tara:strand:- start:174 stop:1520 length:1347 start_codon:yes stop_codon:yes gene_type:complete
VPTSLKQLQTQKQKLAPRQILQARLLQLSSINLEQAIVEELEQNPLLEQVEPEDQQIDEKKDDSPIDDIDVSMEDMYSDESTYYLSEQKKEMPLPERRNLLEDLIDQLKDSNMTELEKEISEEIIWNTNERGFLDTDLILIADRFELLEEEIEPILQKVQRLDPKGVGSRNLRECLMIQLEANNSSLAFNLVDNYFEDFMHKRYEKIISKLQCSKKELHDAIAEISYLNPHPGEGYRDKFQTVIPDLIIVEENNDWVITTNDGGIPELRISQDYEHKLNGNALSKDAKRFIKSKMDSANWFIEAIQQRRSTLVHVMRSIIKFQPEWFGGDTEYLRPLKLQDISDEIGMDISTISRSTRGKYVDTPYGIFELKHFFTDSIKLNDGLEIGTYVIKRSLDKIINSENKQKPLSDDELVIELDQRGYNLARRTVAKYRDQLGYPVARLRKEI